MVLQLHGFVFGALFFISFLLCNLIMLEIFLTGITKFHCISVEYLVQFVRFWKVMVPEVQETSKSKKF